MEQRYTRISGLDDKIKSISMPYLEWKVLFVIGENTVMDDIVELIDDEQDAIQSTLDGLLERGLIEVTESAGEESEQTEEELVETMEEETVPEEETEAEITEPKEEEAEEINLTEMEEEELEEKTQIEVSAVEEETEVEAKAEQEEEQEEEVDDKTDLSGLFDEDESAAEAEESQTEPSQPAKKEPVQEEIATITGKKIMIIDDSIVIRKMIEIALEEENYHLINTSTGKEGLDSFEKDKPDLVILDMMLPDMNGIDLLKKIKEKGNTPVIMLSGKDSPQLVENAKEVGVNDFLPKPFKDEELVEKVKNLIN